MEFCPEAAWEALLCMQPWPEGTGGCTAHPSVASTCCVRMHPQVFLFVHGANFYTPNPVTLMNNIKSRNFTGYKKMLKAPKNQSHVIADLYFKDSLNPSPRINLFWDDLLENNLFIK